MEEAHTATQELLKLTPEFSAMEWVNARDYKDRAIPKRFLATLRQLGLTE